MNHSCTGPPGYLTSHPEGDCKVEIVPSHNLAGQFASDAGAAAGNTGEAFLEDGPQLRLIHALTSWLGSQAALASNMPAPAAAEAVGAASGALMAAGAGGAGAALWTALSEEATREHELIAHLKRELRASRALWVAHFDLLSQLDELTTAVTTMELVKTAEEMEALAPIEAERHRFVGLYSDTTNAGPVPARSTRPAPMSITAVSRFSDMSRHEIASSTPESASSTPRTALGKAASAVASEGPSASASAILTNPISNMEEPVRAPKRC